MSVTEVPQVEGQVIRFDVVGTPAKQGDKSAVSFGGKARLIEGNSKAAREKHTNWRAAVAWAARQAAEDAELSEPLDGPLGLIVAFRFPMPATRPKWKQKLGSLFKVSAPDLDKLLRALGDALTDGGLIRDDARICAVRASKLEVSAWTGAEVTVYQINEPTREWAESRAVTL